MTKARSLSDFIESDGSVTLVDNQKIKVGTGNDLEIYHSGTNSVIDNNTGGLYIRNNVASDVGGDIFIQAKSGENSATFTHDGAVTLMHDNVTKFATTSTGVDVTGNSDVSGELYVGTNNSTFAENVVRFKSSGTAYIDHNTVDADIVFRTSDASALDTTALTLDGSDGGTAIFNHDVKLGDNGKAVFGSDSDLEIFYDGSNAFIQNHVNGGIYNRARTNWVVQTNATGGGADTAIQALQNAAVELYYDNAKKLETTASGVKITSDGSSEGLTINHSNGNKVAELIHNGSGDEGALKLYDSNSVNVQILGETGQNSYINSGNLGIGNTECSHRVHVEENGTGAITSLRLANENTAVGDGSQIQFTSGTSTVGAAIAGYGTALDQAALIFKAGGDTKRMEIGSNGFVGIGTNGTGGDTKLHVKDAGAIELRLEADSNNSGQEDCFIRFYTDGKSQQGIIGMDNNNGSTLFTGNTENAMVFGTVSALPTIIAAGGNEKLKFNATSNTAYTPDGLWNSVATPHFINCTGAGGLYLGYKDHGSGLYSAAFGLGYDGIDGLGNTAYVNGFEIRDVSSNATTHLVIETDGDIKNTNNSYGSLSDERIKTDIKDANSQWDDIKALKIRNYKLATQPAPYNDQFQIGVIAQELETAGMGGLIKESDPDTKHLEHCPDLIGEKVKSVKYSVLYMKAIKALQEAMERIEALETKVSDLEG